MRALWQGVLVAATVAAAEPNNFLPVVHTLANRIREGRELQETNPTVCRAIALRLMPTPSVKSYDQCFKTKLFANTSHDWSVPGAEVAAQVDCWCQHNLTATIQEYSCCDHSDIYPMCNVDCRPDCSTRLAQECTQQCPSMCFEAAEYIVDAALCKNCNWAKCWPVVKCLTDHAEIRVVNGTLARTCHDTDFTNAPELQNYWKCWKVAPKHTSHWNVLSSLVHCICREGMVKTARDTHCCDSVLYGGGVCDLKCLTEQECATQEAQTCVHSCQRKCPAYEVVPSHDCMDQCLQEDSPCRKYVACRPPSVHTHVCDDGRWPESSSGCCMNNATSIKGCPSMCETQRIWRLDRTRSIPWWARWHQGEGIVAQCSCFECPDSDVARTAKFKKTVSESIWDNGQVMLVDIARREGLRLGPNRGMQELMLKRNDEITHVIEALGPTGLADVKIAGINDRYAVLITDAARTGEDPYDLYESEGEKILEAKKRELEKNFETTTIIVVVSAVVIVLAIAVATCLVLSRKNRETPITTFQENQHVVIGSPVADNTAMSGIMAGAPVTVAAPTKGKGDFAKDLS
uniref:Uncharacterized protein n=1 Tax=Pyrodinium bahamense TaxID=73915 RepID=A0A7R9ZZA3_9DINO